MTKAEAKQLCEVMEKYSFAITNLLYPQQVQKLEKALTFYIEREAIPHIEDSFTKLAFMMIISDLIYQERKGAGCE